MMQKMRGEAKCGMEHQERQPRRAEAWSGGRNRKNSDSLGEQEKEFQANSSVPKGFIRDSEPYVPNWWSLEFKGIKK